MLGYTTINMPKMPVNVICQPAWQVHYSELHVGCHDHSAVQLNSIKKPHLSTGWSLFNRRHLRNALTTAYHFLRHYQKLESYPFSVTSSAVTSSSSSRDSCFMTSLATSPAARLSSVSVAWSVWKVSCPRSRTSTCAWSSWSCVCETG